MTPTKTLHEIVQEEDCSILNSELDRFFFNIIKTKTLEILEEPPGGHDALWDLLRELVLDSDADGNPRFIQ